MLYHIFKPIVFIFLRIYYRIGVKGFRNIPYGKPIILSPNHVNAFIDPVVIATMLRQKMRFFARSDVFKTPLARAVLNDFNISPMYRIQEGYGNVKNNNKTFEECKSLLSKNKTILMFPEGLCILENRLRKLKKGLARILFTTEEAFDFKKEVWVIPIGLNYSCANKFGSSLFVNVGKALHISDYNELYKNDKVKAINEFTLELEKRMRALLVVVNNPANDHLYELLSKIYVDEKIYNSNDKSLEKAHHYKCNLADGINNADDTLLATLKEKAEIFIAQLKKYTIEDKVLYKNKIESSGIGSVILRMLALFAGFPLFIVGVLTNYLPFAIARRVTEKKVKNVEFYASIYITLGMISWLLYYIVQLITVALCFKNWPLLGIYAVMVIITGLVSVKYYNLFCNLKAEQSLLKLTRLSPEIVTELLIKRQEIIALTEQMVKQKN